VQALAFEALTALHLGELDARGASPHTKVKYAAVERHYGGWVLATLGRAPSVADLEPALLRRWQAHLIEGGRSRETAAQYLAVLKALAAVLARPDADDGLALLRRDPLRDFRIPKRATPPVRVFSDAQVESLALACHGTRDPLRNRAFLLLLLDTGLRVSEACALDVDDVTAATVGAQGSVRVRRGKGGKPRDIAIPFGAKCNRALARYLLSTRTDDRPAWLWIGQGGGRWKDGAVRKLFSEMGRMAAIKDGSCHPHRCRATWATNAARAGLSPHLIQAILGHTSLTMTARYTKVADLLEAGYRSHLDDLPRVK
jgi:integrase/recombinase XerC/integrase/recombinase XerD